MNPATIPAWNAAGVLPPVNAAQPVDPDRSPYVVSLADCMLRFGDSERRRAILEGFLRYRAALHATGLQSGFQWVDGSFLEDVERIEDRPPNDIDVVTFFRLPAGRSQNEILQSHPSLFTDGESVKRAYLVDGYLVHLGMEAQRLARASAYWYSVWSHRRTEVWKGFIQLDLAPTEDAFAAATLTNLAAGGAP